MIDKHKQAIELLALIDALGDSEVKYKLYCELQKWIEGNVRNNIKESIQKQESAIKTISWDGIQPAIYRLCTTRENEMVDSLYRTYDVSRNNIS